MLEHQKSVLLGVAQYPSLFKKELEKSLTWLNAEDSKSLYLWITEALDKSLSPILDEVFCQNTLSA